MNYTVNEIFYTLQGEGANAGRPAVFCRFAGCNLWSGREADRATAICKFCDTDFLGTHGRSAGLYASAEALALAVALAWPSAASPRAKPLVICTGGEPLLQLDEPLVQAFHARGLEVAIETNGTRLPPPGIDWICVSPKAGADFILRRGHELKLIFPQSGLSPARFEPPHPDRPPLPLPFEDLEFQHYFLQPMDGPELQCNLRLAVEYCLEHPQWRLSLQVHKLLKIP